MGWWEPLIEAASGHEVLPNLLKEAKELKPSEEVHREAKRQWAAAKEVYGWGHVKTQRAALRLAELEAGRRKERLLRRALGGLEVTLGLHHDTLQALKSLALLVPELALLQKWRRAAQAFLGPSHGDTIQASWHLAIHLRRAGSHREAAAAWASRATRSKLHEASEDLFSWLACRCDGEDNARALLGQASALKDLGSWGHAELLARQVLQSPHLVASAALFLGETLLLQHGESLTEAYWRSQPLPVEDRGLLLEAEQLFRSSGLRGRAGLAQTLLQLTLLDGQSRILEAEALLQEEVSDSPTDFSCRANLAFCLQLLGRLEDAKRIYEEVLPAYCQWAERQPRQQQATSLSLSASVIGAVSAAYNCACLDGDVKKLRWALAATLDVRLRAFIAKCLVQHLSAGADSAEIEQLRKEHSLTEAPQAFLALWPPLPSRLRWRSAEKRAKGISCCGSARCAACKQIGH